MRRRELVRDRSGRPIVGCESGSGDLRVFLAAGAHGDEPAGVLAALRLVARYSEPEFRFRRVPIRDPAGHAGFLVVLRELTDEDPPKEYSALREFIASHGRVIHDDGFLLLADFDRVVIAFAPPEEGGEDAINDRIATAMGESSSVYEELLGRHIFMPANQPKSEGVGLYQRGFTSYVSRSGRLGNYNRFFGDSEAPPEVAAVAEFLDEFGPHFTIDMHEGFGDCFYAVLDSIEDGIDYLIARPPVNALRICSRGELDTRAKSRRDGVIEAHIPDSLAGYARRHGYSVTTETGLEAPLNKRILAHVQAFERILRVAEIREAYETVKLVAKKALSEAPTHHGWPHVERVRRLGIFVGKRLGANLFVVDLAALLHDITANVKREGHNITAAGFARRLLNDVGLDRVAEPVARAIEKHSRSSGPREYSPEELSLKVADLLDAIGYIGVYRAIAYGESIGRDERGFVEHAREKLLRIYAFIAERVDDPEILAEARRRHEELKAFLEGLERELRKNFS